MSKALAAVAVLLAVASISLLSLGASPHSHTITLSGTTGTYTAAKDAVIEIDYGHTSTFTVQNNADVDLDFVFDAGPNGRKCRVDFTPNAPGKCETTVLTVPKAGSITFTATAKDMYDWEYSYFKVPALGAALPRFQSDIKIGEVGGPLKKVDPDLEIERDPPPPLVLTAIIATLLAGFGAWWTRRRS